MCKLTISLKFYCTNYFVVQLQRNIYLKLHCFMCYILTLAHVLWEKKPSAKPKHIAKKILCKIFY